LKPSQDAKEGGKQQQLSGGGGGLDEVWVMYAKGVPESHVVLSGAGENGGEAGPGAWELVK
jgi:hypothetical protein